MHFGPMLSQELRPPGTVGESGDFIARDQLVFEGPLELADP